MHSSPLSPSAQAAYAQLLDACLSVDATRSPRDLPGSFASKKVREKIYHYFQYTEPSGALRQIYVGPDTPAVRKIVADHASGHQRKNNLSALARSAAALGCQQGLSSHVRVITRLADYGFFRAGGVLIGTHAFAAMGNMLGVAWNGAVQTQDVDFAHAGSNVSVALPCDLRMDTHAAIESLSEGFLPASALTGKAGASYLHPKHPDFSLDFLTPMTRDGQPFLEPRLGIKLQPIRLMEYLLEDVQQAVVFSSGRVALVNVPSPYRYAVHKIMISAERGPAQKTKAVKDVWQAASMIEATYPQDSALIVESILDAITRGPGWRKRWDKGLMLLDSRHADVAAVIRDITTDLG
ncbi:MAG: nucleotidyltransferase domain-containing protein [Alphaproteobacteria bacterium]|nr:nucleotidyltransferase domain-containing protein [Alphaproteobacteria bacterium]